MKTAFISSCMIGGLVMFSLGIVWCETIVQWTNEENMKFYVEYQCYKPGVFCESQNYFETITLLGVVVVGMVITLRCYLRFDIEIPNEVRK